MTDAAAFEAFVKEFQDMVFRTALRLLGRPSDAEDIAQTVFVKAFEHRAAVVGNPQAAGWLKTTTTNACLNHLSRHRARWRLFSEMEDRDAPAGSTAFADRIPAVGSASDALADREVQARLERALRDLPDHQRVPLVLFHFEDRSYQEIADMLRVSLGKVKTDMHRGREALRLVLEPVHGSC
jgi:RNA polymerase sigma-70 factor (ECF subfamily)